MEEQKMISAEETAKRLGISRATLSRLVRDSRIGHYRIGKRTMFSEEVLKDFAKATFQPPVANNRKSHERKEKARRSETTPRYPRRA